MIQPFKFLSREVRGMHQAAYLLAAFSLGSQILALVRDHIFASVFGAGHTLDLYYAAFRVPDFLFATVASLFSLYALLPILSRLEREQEGLMISFLRDMIGIFFASMSVIALVLFVATPSLVPLVAPGLLHDPASTAQLIMLMRILLLQPILLGASNTIAALTQLRHRFILYSVSPLLYNIGIIFGAVVLYPISGLVGLGWGVVLGALLHFGVQVPYLLAEKRHPRLAWARLRAGVREVLTLSIPRTFALASTQISLLILVAIASFLDPGSIAIFAFALNLQAVPLTIIGVSYSVAAFPTLARLHAEGATDTFTSYVEAALRHVIFWSIPATVFVIVMRAQIVRVILGAGQFDWHATRLTAAALAILVFSLLAQSITLLIARAYYATGNTRKPLYFGCADIIISVASAVLFLAVFQQSPFVQHFVESLLRVGDTQGAGVLMLALGYACGSIAEFIIGYFYFLRDFKIAHAHLWRLSFESFSSAVIGSAVAYAVLAWTGSNSQVNTTLALIGQSMIAGTAGLATTAFFLWLLKNQEFAEALVSLRARFYEKPAPVAVDPSDVA
jgi:putative peptidoglycan lipid II flippase